MSKKHLPELEDDQEDWGVFLHHRNRPQKRGLKGMKRLKTDEARTKRKEKHPAED